MGYSFLLYGLQWLIFLSQSSSVFVFKMNETFKKKKIKEIFRMKIIFKRFDFYSKD